MVQPKKKGKKKTIYIYIYILNTQEKILNSSISIFVLPILAFHKAAVLQKYLICYKTKDTFPKARLPGP